MNATTGPAGDVFLLIPGTEVLAAAPAVDHHDEDGDEGRPECSFCHRPVWSMAALRWRVGGKCRRKLRARQRTLLGVVRRPRGGHVEQDPIPGL